MFMENKTVWHSLGSYREEYKCGNMVYIGHLCLRHNNMGYANVVRQGNPTPSRENRLREEES